MGRKMEFPHMTVSEALGAHACAQIAAARAGDEARRMAGESDQVEVVTESRSFVDSWAVSATVIGVSRAN
jgi:hypothetical protein